MGWVGWVGGGVWGCTAASQCRESMRQAQACEEGLLAEKGLAAARSCSPTASTLQRSIVTDRPRLRRGAHG